MKKKYWLTWMNENKNFEKEILNGAQRINKWFSILDEMWRPVKLQSIIIIKYNVSNQNQI